MWEGRGILSGKLGHVGVPNMNLPYRWQKAEKKSYLGFLYELPYSEILNSSLNHLLLQDDGADDDDDADYYSTSTTTTTTSTTTTTTTPASTSSLPPGV